MILIKASIKMFKKTNISITGIASMAISATDRQKNSRFGL